MVGAGAVPDLEANSTGRNNATDGCVLAHESASDTQLPRTRSERPTRPT